MNKKLSVAYTPVISKSYVDFFSPESHKPYIIEPTLLHEIGGVRKDIRALDSHIASVALSAVLGVSVARITDTDQLDHIFSTERYQLLLPDDDVTDFLISRYELPSERYEQKQIFLRWNRKNIAVNVDVDYDETITETELPEIVIQQLKSKSLKSVDWWRQVGCIIFDDNTAISGGRNRYVPNESSAEIDGDIRSQSNRGTDIEIANAIHAEAQSISSAAKNGIKLDKAKCVVSTFPCPVCAKLIANSGISTLYYYSGYAMADGLNVLKSNNVNVVKVVPDNPTSSNNSAHRTIPVPYKSS